MMQNRFLQFPALSALQPRSLKHLGGMISRLVENRLWLKVLIGMLLGLIVGFAIGPAAGWVEPKLGSDLGNWLALPGQLFLAVIQMIVIPLVFASIIRGLAASEDVGQLRKLGISVSLYFVVTTAIAAALGLWIAGVINPGAFLDPDALRATVHTVSQPADTVAAPVLSSLPEKLIHLLPGNPLDAMVKGEMLQVVIFAAVVGIALVSMAADQAKPLLELLGSLQQVCMTVVKWAMGLAPVAVFGLMARVASQMGMDALLGMAVYVLTVLLGLLLLLVLYVLMVLLFARLSPLVFLRSVREVLLLAFSTSSSAAVMPLSIRCAEEKLGVRPSVSQFVIPLGATINMNGTALYQAVAAMFLAQVYGVDISIGGMALVVAMTVGASIGSPATPGVGIVILAMVLGSIGIPASGIALIIGVDRILDMSRTAINVAGDLVAAKLMDTWVGSERSLEEELREEARLDQIRRDTGADVVAGS